MASGSIEVGAAAAEEIFAAYEAIEGPRWDGDKAIRQTVHAPSLGGVAYSASLAHQVSYSEPTGLRRGKGVIAQVLTNNGVCSGDVIVWPASDDFDF